MIAELNKNLEGTLYNRCFSGYTKIITKDGIKLIKDLVDKEIKVLNVYGEWEDAVVKDCGRQELVRLTIRYRNFTKDLYATKNHDWLIEDGLTNNDCVIDTQHLMVEDRIPFNKSKKENINILTEAISDGYNFAESSYAKINKDVIYESSEYLYWWLFGYMTNKAYIENGECFISDFLENIEIIRDMLCVIGFPVGEICGTNGEYLLHLPEEHIRDKFITSLSYKNKTNRPWVVEEIKETGIIDEVYCVNTKETHTFTLDGNILTCD